MKKRVQILTVMILLVTAWFMALLFHTKNARQSYPVEDYFATESTILISPSHNYSLTLQSEQIEGVKEFRIVVKTSNDKTLYSDETFRARDTLLVLWDDELDRIWAYSGDVGVFYWDIVDNSLIVNRYSDHKEETAPEILRRAKPNIFQS